MQKMAGALKYELQTVSVSKRAIKTAGGITVVPDITLEEIDEMQAGALLLIGGDTWQEKSNQPILEMTNSFLEKNILVGAICGATLGLANNGILNSYYHTSNALFFLQGSDKNCELYSYCITRTEKEIYRNIRSKVLT